MSSSTLSEGANGWLKDKANYVETIVILLIALYSLFLQHGHLNSSIIFTYQTALIVIGSLCVWFANKTIFERILQARIESDKITRKLPLELLTASILVTSLIYIIIYLTLLYIEQSQFVLKFFLQGFSGTIGLSLLIMMLYLGNQLWNAWWSDGTFLFSANDRKKEEIVSEDYISIKNSRGIVQFNFKEIRYFVSESRIVFLVDTTGKKWITQYNLSDLENILKNQFFRLNRKIIVSRQAISQVKKLPNHRLLVTIEPPSDNHFETISRYKSTKFKQWFQNH